MIGDLPQISTINQRKLQKTEICVSGCFMGWSNSMLCLMMMMMMFFVAVGLSGVSGCFSSIFNFGDSLSDTGNLFATCSSNEPVTSCFSPYGQTFFRRPTGRFSDGRLIVDFIAEAVGVPLLQPYLEGIGVEDLEKGLNFAVAGATALNASYLQQNGFFGVPTNYSLAVQLEWFKNLCASSSITKCRKILKNSLVLVGEIGGNDYNYPFFDQQHSFEEIKSLVPLVIKEIATTIIELIKLGAETLMVPGNLPIGCNPTYLKIYGSTSAQDFDPKNGCLKWLNQFSEYHNEQLQDELKRIRASHPHVHVIYADYYNSAMRFYNDPQNFGLTNTLEVCYVRSHKTFDKQRQHGMTSKTKTKTVKVCDDPSKYVSWDGIHLTEAAYKLMATALLQGPYTNPQFTTLCNIISQNSTSNLLQLQ